MRLMLTFFIAVFIVPSVLIAGQGVEMELETKQNGETDIAKMIVMGDNIKIEVTDSDSADFVTFDGNKMCTIDNEKSECSCMTKEDIEKIASELEKQMAGINIDEMLKDVPPEYREQAKAMMQKNMPGQAAGTPVSKPDLKKLGSESYNGYPSTKYLLTNSTSEKTYLWVTDWNRVKGGKEVADAFVNLGRFFDDMIEATSKFSQGVQREHNDFMRILDDVNGFIHSSKTIENGKVETETKLLKSFKRSMNKNEFSSPYTCKSPVEQMMQ